MKREKLYFLFFAKVKEITLITSRTHNPMDQYLGNMEQ